MSRHILQSAPCPLWSWPVDIMSYDRTSWLSDEEQTALDSWIICQEREHGGRIPQQMKHTLHRLLLPISDVLNLTEIDESSRRGTIRLIALAMQQRKTAFWAWSSEEWIEILTAKECKTEKSLLQQTYRLGHEYRGYAMALAYLLCDFKDLHRLGVYYRESLINKLFGEERAHIAVQQVLEVLKQWGYKALNTQKSLPNTVYETLLVNRHPCLEAVTRETLEFVYHQTVPSHLRNDVILLSRVLVHLGIIAQPLTPTIATDNRYGGKGAAEGIHEEWVSWCQRWRDISTFAPNTRESTYYNLLKAGHWLAENHPEITSPEQWTRAVTIEYVAAVDHMVIGQWVPKRNFRSELTGKPLTARTKSHILGAISVFFRDCQEWAWIPRRFDPRRCFSTPRAVRSLIGPDPRVIADDIWAKLLWAGLTVTEEDLPRASYHQGLQGTSPKQRDSWYPMEMFQAMVITWLFTGLRKNEFSRLRVGCIRWQREDVVVPWTGETLPKDAVCFLDVPVNKTGTAFTKPVDRCVGEAMVAWEHVRPIQPLAFDAKTSEVVSYLFSYRGRRVGPDYINHTIIPVLCRRAGVPEQDARGQITSHRARSTIASQLFNAKEPLSLFELQEWLGHRKPRHGWFTHPGSDDD